MASRPNTMVCESFFVPVIESVSFVHGIDDKRIAMEEGSLPLVPAQVIRWTFATYLIQKLTDFLADLFLWLIDAVIEYTPIAREAVTF